ncbi:hypothetical protein [Arthrobacter sp. VKM Ac-2550]|uniref:hypothetical protein n=1 Tax=Crystallibacter permensis TaxID=1938888 RepID=UPI0022270FA8|nr:hypothetical protein [Arthrobacter sp. VKM Ac-2550]MCW2135342.1 hypothetical protein [Arthrobacter sp. VKM Ac-2550]
MSTFEIPSFGRRAALSLIAGSTAGSAISSLLGKAETAVAPSGMSTAEFELAIAKEVRAGGPRISSAAPVGQTRQANTGRSIVGVFPNAVLAISSYGLAQNENSSIGPAHWVGKNLPPEAASKAENAGHVAVILFKGMYYMQILRQDNSLPIVVRAKPALGTSAFVWSEPLITGARGSAIISTALSADDQFIYWGEYGDASEGPSVYRSANGTDWERVLGPGGFTSRHVHAIAADPYNPGHVWMTTGDAGSSGWVYYSTDYGATWVKPRFGAMQAWQAVQISFDSDWIYFASDVTTGLVVYKADKSAHTPRWHAKESHRYMAVPNGLPSRRITDLQLVKGSNKLSSISAKFSALDIGSRIRTEGQDFIPIDTYIQAVESPTVAYVYSSKSATATVNTARAILGGETWGVMPYYGAVDPDTGIYYFVGFNGASGGNVNGLFAVWPDGKVILLDFLPAYPDARVFISKERNCVLVYGFWRPLLSI